MFTSLAQLSSLYAGGAIMAEQLNPNELITIEELAISNMWEVGALIELLQE